MKFPIARLAVALLMIPGAARAADPFAEGVRTTEPLTPEKERAALHVPPGFEVQLVAGDPDIAKPMNLAFDSRGRLWVSETRLYPYPAKPGAAKKDAIKIIEIGEDGRAAKITTFADGLDIPVGLLPVTGGKSVIAYDINNVCRHSDTDGDGKADKREVLYSGFGYERDTHGMASNFRRGFDGWIYGCHGFNNISDIKGKDGVVLHLQSGNTYRMRMDGSHIEQFTLGQINPFGMCFDPLGNVYTSDSHSKPIYQLQRGGRYEAFDRATDDGLGLAPRMMEHLHGSTAIAGSQFYADNRFPEEFWGNVFTGNVITGRINRDKLEYRGSSPKAIEQEDFLKSDDPWFRPVNTVLGPDGALYVADFYNRIIGHYEVKLDHPGRDFERGRIWRISFKAKDTNELRKFDISRASVAELIETLRDPNLARRMLATNELTDRFGKDAIASVREMLQGEKAADFQRIHGLWALYRLNALTDDLLQAGAIAADASVRVHAMRILSETPQWSASHRELALKGLTDADALVRRCAADALGQHPDAQNVNPLIQALSTADRADSHLVYVIRMSLRNQLAASDAYAKLDSEKLSDADVRAIADVSFAVTTPQAGSFLVRNLSRLAEGDIARALRHAVRYNASMDAAALADVVRKRFAHDIDLQLEVFRAVARGTAQRGEKLSAAGVAWGAVLVDEILKPAPVVSAWTNSALDGSPSASNPWTIQARRSNDRNEDAAFFTTLLSGEQRTGVLRSKAFAIPSKLSMFVAGHNGVPSEKDTHKNVIRLREAKTDAVLMESFPPRNDTARRMEWKLQDHAGKQGYIEVTDADDGGAYAWIAFGRIDPPVAPLPSASPTVIQRRLQSAAQIAADLKIKEAAPELTQVMLDKSADVDTRVLAAHALAATNQGVSEISKTIADASEPMALREKLAATEGSIQSPEARDALVGHFRAAPQQLQTSLAMALTGSADGAEALLVAVADGKAPARVLLEPGIHDRLSAAGVADLESRMKALTRGVAPAKDEITKLIAERRSQFASTQPSASRGEALFAKNCVICHQVDGKGAVVGPQLAGMSKRGIDRLLEDVLDPNRNVDPAFRYSNVILKDGRLITGLQRRTEGELIVLSDTTGKEISVAKSDIKQRIESNSSLMPGNFGEILSAGELCDVMAFLLTK